MQHLPAGEQHSVTDACEKALTHVMMDGQFPVRLLSRTDADAAAVAAAAAAAADANNDCRFIERLKQPGRGGGTTTYLWCILGSYFAV